MNLHTNIKNLKNKPILTEVDSCCARTDTQINRQTHAQTDTRTETVIILEVCLVFTEQSQQELSLCFRLEGGGDDDVGSYL